ncbi:hypothetical protein FJT64_027102 [Amphibalanus amphitrite]|uniref:Uncharacterized protein n=1 Tax=Amphibalanus amphitrite TaxID=1232801 RepID=A0A6A4WEJ1_AMPAM|nr:hypothetical protein FJT64_027102 [Amphibalanus amphitrite]
MTLFPLGSKKKKYQHRSITADTPPVRKPTVRTPESFNVNVPQGVLASLSQANAIGGSRLTLGRPASMMHPAYQKWKLKEPARRELSQGDGKSGLKDAIQKINRLTLNTPAMPPGQKMDLASRTLAAKERKSALKSHIVDLSNLFHAKSKVQTTFVNKSNAKKQQDLKNDIMKYFEENGMAMSFLNNVKGMTPIKFYRPSLPTIAEETDEEMAKIS